MTIYYPDISSAQGDISLRGALAAAIKVTEGTAYTNPFYLGRMADAAHNGTFGFAYHFLHQGNGAGQAQYCHARAGATPLMVDFEPYPQIGSFPKLPDCTAFIDEYRHLGGTTWLAYLPHWYWQDLGSPDLGPLRDRGMRLVSSDYVPYTDAGSGAGWQPYGGMTPDVWQYTSRLSFNGQAVDFNAFRGSYGGRQDAASVAACLAEFKSLARTGRLAPAPGPAPQPASDGGPYRHVAPQVSGESLAKVAEDRNTTVAHIRDVSAGYLTAEHLAVLDAYIALLGKAEAAGIPRPVMPTGLIYATDNR